MLPIRHFLLLACLVFPQAVTAQQRSLSAFGVVLMHGKGGQPGSLIGDLAESLEAEGVKVVMPAMAWSGTRGQAAAYDVTYAQSLKAIDKSVAQLRRSGARRIVIAGQSLGANAAIAYAAQKPAGLVGVIALAPGHTPERMRQPEIQAAVARAYELVASGQGATRGVWPDVNVGQSFKVNGTAEAYFSFFDPNGLAVMPKTAGRLATPLLLVTGRSDPLLNAGRYIFDQAKPHAKSRYVEIDASHFNTPGKAKDDVVDWLKSL
jgi:pimeloyl-ACP methyl ester carboxylesterase